MPHPGSDTWPLNGESNSDSVMMKRVCGLRAEESRRADAESRARSHDPVPDPMKEPLSGNELPVTDNAGVPVFDCHVILNGPDENGLYKARAANLRGVVGGGNSERQALLSIVTAFKAVVADYHRNGEPIPWNDPPESPGDGEVERWIPVHL